MSDGPQSPRRKPPKREHGEQRGEWNPLSLVFEFLGYLALLGYLGHRLDQHYGWNGRGLFVGLMVGLVAWIYRVLRTTRGLFK